MTVVISNLMGGGLSLSNNYRELPEMLGGWKKQFRMNLIVNLLKLQK